MRYTNGCVDVGGSGMYYVSFGEGKRNAVFIPGLSDGLATVDGKARLLSKPYKPFLDRYTVWMFSRRNDIPAGFSIRDMAEDQARAMTALGLEKAYVAGVSQGGMISQYLAAGHPETVEKLVLAVTAPYANDVIKSVVGGWIEMAERGDHKALMVDTAYKSCSDAFIARYGKFFPALGLVGKPKSYDRFEANANAILGFDARDMLDKINCPTLIIGGDCDKTVGTEAAGELHERIKGSELHIYEGLGHAAYEEAKDFNDRVFEFFDR